jgi:hypothetical protein
MPRLSLIGSNIARYITNASEYALKQLIVDNNNDHVHVYTTQWCVWPYIALLVKHRDARHQCYTMNIVGANLLLQYKSSHKYHYYISVHIWSDGATGQFKNESILDEHTCSCYRIFIYGHSVCDAYCRSHVDGGHVFERGAAFGFSFIYIYIL